MLLHGFHWKPLEKWWSGNKTLLCASIQLITIPFSFAWNQSPHPENEQYTEASWAFLRWLRTLTWIRTFKSLFTRSFSHRLMNGISKPKPCNWVHPMFLSTLESVYWYVMWKGQGGFSTLESGGGGIKHPSNGFCRCKIYQLQRPVGDSKNLAGRVEKICQQSDIFYENQRKHCLLLFNWIFASARFYSTWRECLPLWR